MSTCFVVMGFGEKIDYSTGRKLNLDATYKSIIKPTVEEAGYKCVRADEIRHSGLIDIPMYDMLLDAELVIADLSTGNLNAVFELGIRHALKPRSTIIMAEKNFVSPFDINHIVINPYEHLEKDIGFGEVMRMKTRLLELIVAIAQNGRPDSPVYSLLKLTPPSRPATPAAATPELQTVPSKDSYAAVWDSAMELKQRGDFAGAEDLLKSIYTAQTQSPSNQKTRTPRPRVVQELALAIYKGGDEYARSGNEAKAASAYRRARDQLRELEPDHTTDAETLGLWVAAHKRLASLSEATAAERHAALDTAIYAAERGFLIRQDHYTGLNLAFMLDWRASMTSGDDQIADRVLAYRARQKVAEFAVSRLQDLKVREASEGPWNRSQIEEIYWLHATIAETRVANNETDADQNFENVLESAPAPWMADTTRKQIEKIKQMRHR